MKLRPVRHLYLDGLRPTSRPDHCSLTLLAQPSAPGERLRVGRAVFFWIWPWCWSLYLTCGRGAVRFACWRGRGAVRYRFWVTNGITVTSAGFKSIHPHTLTSLEGCVTIFSDKMTFKMAAEPVIQFSDHVRYKDMSYQRMWSITGLC